MAAAAMRTALTRLGFSNAAAHQLVDEEGIDSPQVIQELTDDEIESLIKSVRQPGGTIPNPQAAIAGQPAVIPNRGIPISMMAGKMLKQCSYYLEYRKNAGLVSAAADITLDNVRSIATHMQTLANHEDPSSVPDGIINNKDWRKTFENLDEHIHAHRGSRGQSLLYLCRESKAAVAAPTAGWASKDQEMINRCAIYEDPTLDTPAFTDAAGMDNDKLFKILQACFKKSDAWIYAKDFIRSRNGRDAYLAIKNRYLGPNATNNQASAAEAKINTLDFAGNKRHWDFDKYVNCMTEQFNTLNYLQADGAHPGIDDASKVRKLLGGIKTKDLDPVKTQILASATLQHDYDRCVALFKDYITMNNLSFGNKSSSLHIAALGSDGKKGAGGKGQPKRKIQADDVQDRFYSKSEYNRFTPEAKEKLYQLRANRTNGRPAKKQKISALSTADLTDTVNAAVTTAISSLNIAGSNSQQQDQSTPRASNTNPALSRNNVRAPA